MKTAIKPAVNHLPELSGAYFQKLLDAQSRFLSKTTECGPLAMCATPSGAMAAWSTYTIDRAQRVILFLDTMRRQGEKARHGPMRKTQELNDYEHQLLCNGRDLPCPVSDRLLRVVPSNGMRTNDSQRPYVILDPDPDGQPISGALATSSQVRVAMRACHSVYFISAREEFERAQSLRDVLAARATFLSVVQARHPRSPRPVVVASGNACVTALLLAAASPDLVGPLVLSQSNLSGNADPGAVERSSEPIARQEWLERRLVEIGLTPSREFDPLWYWERMMAPRTDWERYYELFIGLDEEPRRALEGHGSPMGIRPENPWVQGSSGRLEAGDRRFPGAEHRGERSLLDLGNIRSPILLIAAHPTPDFVPPRELSWVADLYPTTESLVASGQVVVWLFHEGIGGLGFLESRRSPRKEYGQVIELSSAVESLGPGLYLARIQEQGLHRGVTSRRFRFEEIRVEDLPGDLATRRQERDVQLPWRTTASSARSENLELDPTRWIRPARPNPTVDLARAFNPFLWTGWILRDLDCFMPTLSTLSEAVRDSRLPAESDNPFVGLEMVGARAIGASIDLFRDLRDATFEVLVHQWRGPRPQAGRSTSRNTEAGPSQTWPRDLGVHSLLDRVERGGFVEAVARVGALMALGRGEFPLARLSHLDPDLASDPELSRLDEHDAERISFEQNLIAELRPGQALLSLPRLLPHAEDRTRLSTLLDRAIQGITLCELQRELLAEIRSILNTGDARPQRERVEASSPRSASRSPKRRKKPTRPS